MTSVALDDLGDDGGVIGGFGALSLDGTDNLSFVVFVLGVLEVAECSRMGDGDVERVN